jgi:hypothetical protein
MAEWEENLPPLIRERLARIGKLTKEERERILDSEKADSLLAEFYRGEISPEELWQRLKQENRSSLLREVQLKLLESLHFKISSAELKKRRDAILAVESLKQERNIPAIEQSLKLLEDLPKRYQAEIERTYKSVRAEVERNPQLRVKQIQQGQNTVIIQLSVDEAVKQLPEWKNFVAEREKKYGEEFSRILEKLRKELM